MSMVDSIRKTGGGSISGNTPIILDINKFTEVSVGSTSKGNQRKFYDKLNQLWFKEQFYWNGTFKNDWKVELIASDLGSKIVDCKILHQDYARLNERDGVLSHDFNHVFVPVSRILDLAGIAVNCTGPSVDTFRSIVSGVKKYTDVDITKYLLTCMVLDFFLLNTDRHLGNIGVFKNGSYSVAYIFDNGLGLFEDDDYDDCYDMYQALDRITCKPYMKPHVTVIEEFSESCYHDYVSAICKSIVNIDVKGLLPNKFAREWWELKDRHLRRLNLI